MATNWIYMPILKWKQGERMAVKNLTAHQCQDIVVMLELLAIDAAPDAVALKAALPLYLSKIVKDIKSAFPEGACIAVDTRHIAPGYTRQLRLSSVVCKLLGAKTGRIIIPVVSESAVQANPADLKSLNEFPEIILRIRTNAITDEQIPDLIQQVTDAGISGDKIHLVIDQYSIVGEEPVARAALVEKHLAAALAQGCASTTLAGGSFPMNLIGYKQGAVEIGRVEWMVWEIIKGKSGLSGVRYADYTVTNPAPLPADLDTSKVNPSVAIRYTCSNSWRLYKAGGFKNGAPDQYRGLCQLLITDGVYSQSTFSYGDQCYAEAAAHRMGNGNPSSWRRDATNHHIVFTKAQLTR